MIDYRVNDVDYITNLIVSKLHNDGVFKSYIRWLLDNEDIQLYDYYGGFRYLEYIDKWKTETGLNNIRRQ